MEVPQTWYLMFPCGCLLCTSMCLECHCEVMMRLGLFYLVIDMSESGCAQHTEKVKGLRHMLLTGVEPL